MKTLLYFVIAATSVAAFVFLYYLSYDPRLEAENPKAKSRALFLGKRKARSVPKGLEDRIHSGCEELETILNELDFRLPAEQWVINLEQRELDQCEDPLLEEKLKIATESCFAPKPKYQDCVMNLVYLRSHLRTRTEADTNNPENAADLIIREFGQKTPDFKKLNEYAEKLLDINPSNLMYQKMWAVSKFISAVDGKKGSLPARMQDEIYGRLDPALITDLEFQPYRFYLESAQEPAKAEEFARNFVSQYPEHSQAHEILGWSLWKQGRREEAMAALNQAIKYNPKDPWLKKLRQDLGSPNATGSSYLGRLHMDIRFEDLFD